MVPVTMLRADLRLMTVRRLFPVDRRVEGGWEHSVLDPFGGGEESWEWLAELFAGRPGEHAGLRRANPAATSLRRGRTVLIPESILLQVFRSLEPRPTPTPRVRPSPSATPTLPPTPTRRPTPTPPAVRTGPAVASGALTFDRDARGDHAVYRLRRGEALYSAVVVRFTGQLHAEDVNATAAQIARRSGIEDVTAIPVGYPIRIPLDLLLPEHLPRNHPRRRAWEQEQSELARFVEIVHATDLSGVHVIIDAGHGGADSGAAVAGIWESTYVYDIACRIKANLERHTRATVWMIRQDDGLGYRIPDKDRLVQDRDQFLETRPRYHLGQSTMGVHLRWYLVNDIITGRLGKEVPRTKTVFVSVHADSLHASVRGAMVYVPSRHLRPDSHRVRLKELRTYQEYRNHPEVELSSSFKARSEASSRHLAEEIVRSLERNKLMVHPYEPIRDRVLRGRKSWVPAVLRFSLAQHAVLLECCNMANQEDREKLLDQEWRERFARTVVEGMAAAFSPGS
jgi:N-acetylmuramoyl-L-alanine amidase